MTQRLALCRVLLHDPQLLVLDEPYSALDAAGADLLDVQLAELRGERTLLVSTHDPGTRRVARDRAAGDRMTIRARRARARAEGPAARAARTRHAAGDAAVRRRDLRRLPLRAPVRARRSSRRAGCSGSRSSSRRCSASARAFVPEREQHVLDGLVLAPCDRSAIWLAKALATLAFLAAAEVVALPVFALFFHGVSARDRGRRSSWQTSGSAPSAPSSGRWRSPTRARDLLLPLLFLPLAIPIVVGGVGASVVSAPGALPRLPGALRRPLRHPLLGHLRVCRRGGTIEGGGPGRTGSRCLRSRPRRSCS